MATTISSLIKQKGSKIMNTFVCWRYSVLFECSFAGIRLTTELTNKSVHSIPSLCFNVFLFFFWMSSWNGPFNECFFFKTNSDKFPKKPTKTYLSCIWNLYAKFIHVGNVYRILWIRSFEKYFFFNFLFYCRLNWPLNNYKI